MNESQGVVILVLLVSVQIAWPNPKYRFKMCFGESEQNKSIIILDKMSAFMGWTILASEARCV
jgi:hypothetical protein